ncbi:putative glutamate--tRNA ligase-like protein [Dinothrombium tinctorium]|uniref:Nondiscriminating glutamyl-tRNA synthetase EARS2, mitochondrial n=1 Tax=Dinothrombium tinctorium TaxID=1965070 RepID=A0A443R3Q0_9ACAR|nr:putative glutamate--tRNA ligase-like protein [Dinothrombium tinctorium]
MSTSCVTVRFAPSPTGFPHLGSLRTAFYNYVFAKQFNGKFVLRIEDTDKTRIVGASVQSIVDTLKWVNLIPDEGPIFQSERKALYQQKANELLEKEAAYRCFCSQTRLELLRKEAAKNREMPRYDRRCFHLSKEEIKDNFNKKIPFTIRFKLPNELVEFEDMIFGMNSTNVFEVESDPILLKSDGFPTYHLANVVDDNDMKVTHILRGEEWLTSTPKHVLLYRAFGWQPPKFAHLPLLKNKDGSKLSKRNDDLRVDVLRKEGYLPEAIINYLRTIGGGFQNLCEDKIYDLNEIISSFKLDNIHTHACKLDIDKLNLYNRLVIGDYLQNNSSHLVSCLRTLISDKFGADIASEFDDDYLKYILKWSNEGPPIDEILLILGDEKFSQRLKNALSYIKSNNTNSVTQNVAEV